jgi:hypothetical protein
VQSFLHAKIIVQHVLVLVQDGKLACDSFPPWQNDVIREELVLMQDGKLACASCPPMLE